MFSQEFGVIVGGFNDKFYANSADFQKITRENNGVNFLLVVTDIVTSRAFVQALKDKTADSIVKGFKRY